MQAAPGKPIPQGATIVKLVNAQGQPGMDNFLLFFHLFTAFIWVYTYSQCQQFLLKFI